MTAKRYLLGSSRRDCCELGKFAEVLDCCCEVELIFGAVWSSKSEAVEADDAFEVGEEHLYLLSGVAGGDIGIGLRDIPCFLAGVFMPGSGDLPGHLVGRASGLQRTRRAILFPGVVFLEAILAERRRDALLKGASARGHGRGGVACGRKRHSVADVNNEGRETIEILKQIHIQKTARLIQLPILLGLIVLGEENKLELGKRVGENVGLIYQVQDDYLDAYADEKVIGKKVGSDSEANKKTYVDFYTKEQVEEIIGLMTNELKGDLKELDVPNELSELLIKLSTREK